MRNRELISLADLLWAVSALGANDRRGTEAIAEMLGFGLQSKEPSRTGGAIRPPSPSPALQQPGGEQAPTDQSRGRRPRRPSRRWPTATTELDLRRGEAPDSGAVAWLQDVKPLAAPDPAGQPARLAHEPLLTPRWTRGILVSALATGGGDGPPDVDRAVALLASQEPVWSVPRLPEPTLRRGAQILVDVGEGMEPFLRDQRELEAQLRLVVGSARLDFLRFVGCPGRGVWAVGKRAELPYEPPRRAVQVVVVTDLGLSRPLLGTASSSEREWLDFAAVLRWAGCPLVAFVPYPRTRVPASLLKALSVIPWDRTTSAADTSRIIGRMFEARG